MPSLSDSLAALADYSAQIQTFAASNLAPAGPYTTAYLDSLHLNPAKRSKPSGRRGRGGGEGGGGVLSLIRDAQESEVRLFRFIGEAEVVGQGRVKRVEKRDEARVGVGRGTGVGMGGGVGGKEGEGEGRDEVEVMLRTALRLVDDYRPMPRARATIASLLDTHHTQLERVAELELQIEQSSNSLPDPTPTPPPASSSSSSSKPKAKLSFEEAVKAEEASLRALESTLAPLRRARLATSGSSNPTSDGPSAFQASSTLPSSPPSQPSQPSLSTRTPAKTPSRDIHVSNSLVNTTTPRRARLGQTPGTARTARDGGVLTEGFEFDRFSPLKFLGTPRARGREVTRSTLREVMGSPTMAQVQAEGTEGMVGRGIFGPRVTSAGWDGAASVGAVSEGGGGVAVEEEDQTVRFIPAPATSTGKDPEPELVQAETEETAQPEAIQVEEAVYPAAEPEGVLEGVQYRLPIVEQAIAKIRDGLPEMLRQGLPVGSEPPSTTETTISHLARLARSDPSPPPSPSSRSTSTLSSLPPSHPTGPPPQPITPQTILTAHLLLALLRGEDAAVSMAELKDDLGALARARGWESVGEVGAGVGGGMVTKCIYHVVGKRVAKIDRKAGARVMFAI